MQTALVLSGLDPSGGAGLCADIQTLSTHHIQPLPIATVLTAQNTQYALVVQNIDIELIKQQIEYLTNDIRVDGIKIGLLGGIRQIEYLTQWLSQQNIPIVLDPIISASTGQTLLHQHTLPTIKEMIKNCTIITPNMAELTQLTKINDESTAVKSLGVEWVLLTKTDVYDQEISHVIYHNGKAHQTYQYKKLAHQYHGSGCTLSSAVIANLIKGYDVPTACQKALNWTYQTLIHANKIGKIQYHPNRHI